MASGTSPEHTGDHSIFSKFSFALSNAYKKLIGSFETQIKNGRTAVEMPCHLIAPLTRQVIGCNTGPYGGLCQLDPELDHPTHDRETPIAGVSNWYRPHPIADGDSITLYEHKPGNTQHHGDPIADVYSIVVRSNNCILAVADGVNWGIKPRLAARCAVHGVMEHLNHDLFDRSNCPRNTQDIFHIILRSFHTGQRLIIKHGGTTTTLCVGVVVELQEPKNGSKWGLCVVSVGDTLCYVWRNESQMVHEVTLAMHFGKDRNPRDCGGCLGCDLGDQPDLSNLLCCFVPLSEEDIVFIVSDGVTDNSDPVIMKEAISENQPLSPPVVSVPYLPGNNSTRTENPLPGSNNTAPVLELPIISPEQRQNLLLMKLTGILKRKVKSTKMHLNAQDVRDAIFNHIIDATEMKRGYLESCWVELDKTGATVSERRINERKIGQHMKSMPGKLDHATLAAYRVGRIADPDKKRSPSHSDDGRSAGKHRGSFSPGELVVYSDGSPSRVLGGNKKKKKKKNKMGKKCLSVDDLLDGEPLRSRSDHIARAATVDYCEDDDDEFLSAGVGFRVISSDEEVEHIL